MDEKLSEDYVPNKNYSDYFNPTLKINLFSKISFELSEFRDNFMLNKIKKTLLKYNRLFIIKEVYHLHKNEEKIRRLLRQLYPKDASLDNSL